MKNKNKMFKNLILNRFIVPLRLSQNEWCNLREIDRIDNDF